MLALSSSTGSKPPKVITTRSFYVTFFAESGLLPSEDMKITIGFYQESGTLLAYIS